MLVFVHPTHFHLPRAPFPRSICSTLASSIFLTPRPGFPAHCLRGNHAARSNCARVPASGGADPAFGFQTTAYGPPRSHGDLATVPPDPPTCFQLDPPEVPPSCEFSPPNFGTCVGGTFRGPPAIVQPPTETLMDHWNIWDESCETVDWIKSSLLFVSPNSKRTSSQKKPHLGDNFVLHNLLDC